MTAIVDLFQLDNVLKLFDSTVFYLHLPNYVLNLTLFFSELLKQLILYLGQFLVDVLSFSQLHLQPSNPLLNVKPFVDLIKLILENLTLSSFFAKLFIFL